MKFNSKKTENMENVFTYKLGDDPLNRVGVVKYLGILLSADLKWNRHVENAISKAYRVLELIKLTLGNAPENVKSLAYETLLEYAAEVWDPTNKHLITKLEVTQNRAIRFINNLKGRELSITAAKFDLGLETLRKRRQSQRISLFCHITANDDLFPTLNNTLKSIKSSTHNMNTRINTAIRACTCKVSCCALSGSSVQGGERSFCLLL